MEAHGWEGAGPARRRRPRRWTLALLPVAAILAGVLARSALAPDTGSLQVESATPAPAAPAGDRSAADDREADDVAAAPAAGRWSPLPDGPLAAAAGAASAWTGTELLLWGGQPVTEQRPTPAFQRGAAYDPLRRRWRSLRRAPLRGPILPVSAWTGDEWLVWGGATWDNRGRPLLVDDGAAYDPAGDRWRPLPPAPLTGRFGAASSWNDPALLVWGGFDRNAGYQPDGALYDSARDVWKPVPAPPLGNFDTPETLALAPLGSGFLAWSSVAGRNLAAVYQPASGTWRQLADPPVAGHVEPLLVAADGAVFAWGSAPSGDFLFRYDSQADRWLALAAPPAGPPAEAYLAGAAWTGEQLITWSGRPPTAGATFDPLTNRWTVLPASEFDGRYAVAAVWTGDELLLWGGFPMSGRPDPTPGEAYAAGATWSPRR